MNDKLPVTSSASVSTGVAQSIFKRLIRNLMIPALVLVLISAFAAMVVARNHVNALYDKEMSDTLDVLSSFLVYEMLEEGLHVEENVTDREGQSTVEPSGHNDIKKQSAESIDNELLDIMAAMESQQGIHMRYRVAINDEITLSSHRVADFARCEEGFSEFSWFADNSESIDNTNVAETQAIEWRCLARSIDLSSPEPGAVSAHLDLDKSENNSLGVRIRMELLEPKLLRTQAIRELLIAISTPVLLLLPLLIALILWVAKGICNALHEVTREVTSRSAHRLDAIALPDAPAELQPLLGSVNQLLQGVDRSLQREKQFINDAAHELRTPITSIGMIEQLLRRSNKDAELDVHLNALQHSVSRSRSLVETLLDMARVESVQTPSFQSVDLIALIEEQLGVLSPQLLDADLEVIFECDSYTKLTHCNASSMRELVDALLSNAVKFNISQGRIFIVLENYSLRIEDDGPGISKAERESVFERFYRSPATREVYGTGLGLAIARRVADIHGYSLSFTRALKGHGAAVVLSMKTRYKSEK